MMLLVSPASTSLLSNPLQSFHGAYKTTTTRLQAPAKVLAMAKQTSDDSNSSTIVEKAAIAGGLVSTPVIGWSLYTLKTTGCGLPPGPGGSIGALEGVSYLAVLGIVGWSLYTKIKTGSGLPTALLAFWVLLKVSLTCLCSPFCWCLGSSYFSRAPFQDPSPVTSALDDVGLLATAILSCVCGHGLVQSICPAFQLLVQC